MYQGAGRVIKSNGGLFTLRLDPAKEREPMPLDGRTVTGRGRGSLHRKGALLVGDRVTVSYDDTAFTAENGEILPATDGTGLAIDRIEDRKNELIRPPMANLDVLFITVAVAAPEPVLSAIDRLIAVAESRNIEPVLIFTKKELNPEKTETLCRLYSRAGFSVFSAGEQDATGTEALHTYLQTSLCGKIAAFSGASGVGKSTLLNRLFPTLSLQTGELSQRIERGKNTTRTVELYPLSDAPDCGYIADTPGFGILDFERFDFFDKELLPETFREFRPYLGKCRYTKCSHTKEERCAVLAAVRNGEIAPTRHQSFTELYDILKKKTKW